MLPFDALVHEHIRDRHDRAAAERLHRAASGWRTGTRRPARPASQGTPPPARLRAVVAAGLRRLAERLDPGRVADGRLRH